jgi:hypothetical protein
VDSDTRAKEPRTIEGPWEEIARQGNAFAGRKVRLTVLEGPTSALPLDRALAQLIESAQKLAETLPPIAPPCSTDSWSEGVLEKYRRQGFTV